jgi:hypothetical protein
MIRKACPDILTELAHRFTNLAVKYGAGYSNHEGLRGVLALEILNAR